MFSIRQVFYKRTERRRGESGSEACAADTCGDGWPMHAAGDSIVASGCNESGGGDIRRRGVYLLRMRRRRVSALSGVGLTDCSAGGRILAREEWSDDEMEARDVTSAGEPGRGATTWRSQT